MDYLLYLPANYARKNRTFPLILFLHGAGERGNDLELVKMHGPPKLAETRDFPFIIVSPQCPSDQWWDIEILHDLLEEVIDQYRVNPRQVYLTGLSMGGYGTWALAAAHPETFAAIAPICGGGDTLAVRQLVNIPVWNFHGAQDPVVPIQRSHEMVQALKNAGGMVKFTIYPEATHDSWTETYDKEELYDWFLEHSKKKTK
jgi:predicted peptidase